MPFSIVSDDGVTVLTLEGAITIRHAQDLAATLAGGLDSAARLEVSTEGLRDIDTCILQLLCSLRKTTPNVSFISPSEVFLGAVERCGLRRELLNVREDL